MKKKLIIVARDTINTGGGYVVEQLIKYLKVLDPSYEIILFTDYKNPFIEKLGIKQITIPLGYKLYKFSPKSKFLKILRHFLQIFIFSFSTLILKSKKYKKYVILDSNNEGFVSDISLTHDVFILTYIKDVKNNKKKFFRILNPVLAFKIIKEWIVLNKASTKCIITISKEILSEVNKICQRDKKKIVIGHGVDVDFFKPIDDAFIKNELKKKYNLPRDSFVLLLSGHEYERKGLKFLIESLKYLPEDIIVVVTGKGIIDPYKKYAQKLKVDHRVYFLGLLEDIRDGYYLSDLFVLPTSYEGWGLVGTEAMATGLPVLMTYVGGIKEYLIDKVNGLIIKRDARDIAQKVLLVKNDKFLYKKLQNNAIKTAKKNSWHNVVKKYKFIIDNISKDKNA